MTAAACPPPAPPIRDRPSFPALVRDRRGISMVEFALGLPLLVGFMLGGTELASYVLAANTCQRLATMTADLVAQSGVGGISTTEEQLYDLFQAIDVSAKPLDMRTRGRVIFTAIRGVRQADGTVRNEWADASFSQQFDGGYTSAVPLLGCRTAPTALPTYGRTLPVGEIMVHAQVSYLYQPLFSAGALSLFNAPAVITRTAVFRMRKNSWNITSNSTWPSKSRCTTANGL